MSLLSQLSTLQYGPIHVDLSPKPGTPPKEAVWVSEMRFKEIQDRARCGDAWDVYCLAVICERGAKIGEGVSGRVLEPDTSKALTYYKQAAVLGNRHACKRLALPCKGLNFGSYPTSKSGEVQPIAWIVLQREKESTLLISRFSLDVVPFSLEQRDVSWCNSSLRRWLNGEFYQTAFTPKERNAILTAHLKDYDNTKYKTKGGLDTEDFVFPLSIDGALQYFVNNDDMIAFLSPYASKRGAYPAQGASRWWLRSPGKDANSAAYAFTSICYSGFEMESPTIAVRPAIWVRTPKSF